MKRSRYKRQGGWLQTRREKERREEKEARVEDKETFPKRQAA